MSNIPAYIPISALVVSAVAAIGSAGLAQVGRRLSSLKAITDASKSKERDYKSEIRLTLVQAILMREVERCKVFRAASGLLVFSQFVVGGMLASSLVTKELGESIVGLLGLVVLGASLVNQHFRPDLLHKVSAEKLRRLRTLKRKLEDKLYVASSAEISNEALIKIRLFATDSLEQIEASELQSVLNEKQQTA